MSQAVEPLALLPPSALTGAFLPVFGTKYLWMGISGSGNLFLPLFTGRWTMLWRMFYGFGLVFDDYMEITDGAAFAGSVDLFPEGRRGRIVLDPYWVGARERLAFTEIERPPEVPTEVELVDPPAPV